MNMYVNIITVIAIVTVMIAIDLGEDNDRNRQQ